MRIYITIILAYFIAAASGQEYDASRIFAHNDYVRAQPFYTAYNLQVGYIEADIFLVRGELLVAHHRNEIEAERTLAALYLEPLSAKVDENGGSVYKDPQCHLTLMVDLKTEGTATLKKLVELLQQYPRLLACRGLRFMISGNVPPPEQWKEYPSFIWVDGRPGRDYTAEQLERVAMISTSFREHVKWDGNGEMSDAAKRTVRMLMDDAHAKGKRFRFWATPDFGKAWREQMNLNFDVIVTDDVIGLDAFFAGQK